MRYGSFRKSTKAFERPPELAPREQRVQVSLAAAIQVAGEPVPVRITDLSAGGFSGISPAVLPIGLATMLSIPPVVNIPIQIRWAMTSRFGARFLHAPDLSGLFETAGLGSDPLDLANPKRRC